MDGFVLNIPPDTVQVAFSVYCHTVRTNNGLEYTPVTGRNSPDINPSAGGYQFIVFSYPNLKLSFPQFDSRIAWNLTQINSQITYMHPGTTGFYESINPILSSPYFSNPYVWGIDDIRIQTLPGERITVAPSLLDFELLEDLPRIINRRHQIIE
ncbi:hypothetical protein [Microseira sp. BLCC-F43]|jgi:hypothetical protein|uniref:hypothetical protein n=1 Tax=Microseira sp. BLCC-F43 TaxID=3153602 RepID=UPI0035B6F2BD